ncbi:hypothetical protein [Burkholderia cenocepacia]|uniref:hypothetical protein n=1 Tax=Burkholderia cenocepacia TaxID=95486 RepID=UPI00076113A2|nr:hypothetical protein [Burkholderia cenocepacia]KWU19103.1 hypothetical protein AS149_12715 [Burkholderia cenocepacia]
MTSPDKTDLLAVVGGLLEHVDRESVELYQALAATGALAPAVTSAKKLDFESFYFEMLGPFEQAVDGLLGVELPEGEKAHFAFKQYRFLDNHLSKLFSTYEGVPFCCDKSETVIRAIVRFVVSGEPIDFSGIRDAYYVPQKVLTSHDEIIGFYEALQSLYHGNPSAYLKAWSALQNRIVSSVA